RREVEATLLDWRYAPQLRDGIAEPVTLEWRVSFPARPGPTRADPSRPGLREGVDPLDSELRRSRILALPVAEHRDLLAAQTKIALSLLEAGRAKRSISARFVVYSDADSAEVPGIIAGDLEAVFNTLADQLLPGIEAIPEEYKVQVVAYRSRQQYQRLLEEMPFYEWSTGFYSPTGLIAFHLEQPSKDAVLSLLLHEGTHAFLDRHVVRRGVALPRWLGEGFADYVGNSAIQRGQLKPGKTVKRKYELRRWGKSTVETGGSLDLTEARRAMRLGEGPSVQDLLTASPEVFYGDRYRLYYATAWLLVHYLRSGDPGWESGRFPKLLLYVAEGYSADAAFRALYGDPAASDAAFRRYVEKF
ncbi:MAG TPA: hypothetical protein VLA66_14775, partial [Thermoanaerobaculia bacterium]|nr:hypothetical protein [Thermoanaerobaculia bacterium]